MSAGKWTVNWDIEGIEAEIRTKAPKALAKGMEHLRGVVVPLVPVQTGNLAGSGGVTVTDLQAELYFPGPYALYQHEGVYYRHGRTGAPLKHDHGESFFLERPMVQEAPTVLGIIEEELFG